MFSGWHQSDRGRIECVKVLNMRVAVDWILNALL